MTSSGGTSTGGTEVPAPGGAAILALGLLGLVAGRGAFKRRR
jgi:hypothetical protein